jgi:hypothetical protein
MVRDACRRVGVHDERAKLQGRQAAREREDRTYVRRRRGGGPRGHDRGRQRELEMARGWGSLSALRQAAAAADRAALALAMAFPN